VHFRSDESAFRWAILTAVDCDLQRRQQEADRARGELERKAADEADMHARILSGKCRWAHEADNLAQPAKAAAAAAAAAAARCKAPLVHTVNMQVHAHGSSGDYDVETDLIDRKLMPSPVLRPHDLAHPADARGRAGMFARARASDDASDGGLRPGELELELEDGTFCASVAGLRIGRRPNLWGATCLGPETSLSLHNSLIDSYRA
jgi:hypothetical protein